MAEIHYNFLSNIRYADYRQLVRVIAVRKAPSLRLQMNERLLLSYEMKYRGVLNFHLIGA